MIVYKPINRFKIATATIALLVQISFHGQGSDGNKTVFEAGLISTSAVEYGCSISNTGTEIFFVRSEQAWGSPQSKGTIYYSKKIKSGWTTPEVAFFSGIYDDSDPHLSSDGEHLFIISRGRGNPESDSPDIWMIDKLEDGSWGQARRLAEPINSGAREYSPRTDKFGNLYFASDREGGFGQGDLYLSRLQDGNYQPPENLGSIINAATGEWNLEVSDAGDILIFEASGRTSNKSPYGDLYISFKSDDVWSIPQNIEELNSTGSDLYPELTSNSVLFFSSSDKLESKSTNIYHVQFDIMLEKYRKSALFPD